MLTDMFTAWSDTAFVLVAMSTGMCFEHLAFHIVFKLWIISRMNTLVRSNLLSLLLTCNSEKFGNVGFLSKKYKTLDLDSNIMTVFPEVLLLG